MKKNFSTIESATMWLLSQGTEIADSNIFPSQIAQFLCGISGYDGAIAFMKGDKNAVKYFLDNVYYNGEESNSFILRAIQLHLTSIATQ